MLMILWTAAFVAGLLSWKSSWCQLSFLILVELIKSNLSPPPLDDHSRVILQPIEDDPSSDYINANYIDVSGNAPNATIGSQRNQRNHTPSLVCQAYIPLLHLLVIHHIIQSPRASIAYIYMLFKNVFLMSSLWIHVLIRLCPQAGSSDNLVYMNQKQCQMVSVLPTTGCEILFSSSSATKHFKLCQKWSAASLLY